MNKEQIAEVIYSDEDSTGRALSINAAALESLPIGTKLYAQLEKAPEPVYQVQYLEDPDSWVDVAKTEYDKYTNYRRIVYAAPPDVAELQKQVQALQAKIDSLMFEFCPERMTLDQIDNWADHQKAVKS